LLKTQNREKRLQDRAPTEYVITESYVRLRRNRKTAAIPESLGRDLQTRSSLLALVLDPIDHSDNATHHVDIESVVGRDLLW
jgi:hypothetical protein